MIAGNIMKGENERLLHEILNEAWPKQWMKDYPGIEGRKFKFDCANPSMKLAIEIDGGIHPFWMTTKEGKRIKASVGGHSSPDGIHRDMEKMNAAVLCGWRVLRYTPQTLRKQPWQIIRDIRTLCGANGKDAGQSLLCFDDAKTPALNIQMRLDKI